MNDAESWFGAVEANDIHIIVQLFRRNVKNINIRLSHGHTPLTLSIALHHQDVFQKLLSLGASAALPQESTHVNPWNSEITHTVKVYPLELACDAQWPQAVVALLQRNASPWHQPGGMQVLLDKAVKWTHLPLIDILFRIIRDSGNYQSLSLGQGLLTLAVQTGNRDVVIRLIEKGLNPNTIHNGMVPLLAAAQLGDVSMCELLIKLGAELASDPRVATLKPNALAMGVQAGLSSAIDTLIDLGASVAVRLSVTNCWYEKVLLSSNSTPLHLAVAKRNQGIIKTLIQAGAPLNAKDNEGNTPLHIACKDPHADGAIVELLITSAQCPSPKKKKKQKRSKTRMATTDESKARKQRELVTSRNLAGLSAAAYCCEQGRADLLDTLISHACVESRDLEEALHCAVRGGHEEVLEHLLDQGVDVNTRGLNQLSALHVAVMYSQVTMMHVLLDHGADIHVTTRNNETSLYLAVQAGSLELVQLLLARGCDVNACTVTGETALMLACCRDAPQLCNALLRHGALIDLQNTRQRETALSMAAYFGCTRAAAAMIAQGADCDKADKRKTTPVYWCIYNGRREILRLLVLAGASLSGHHFAAYPRHLSLMQDTALIQWIHDTNHSAPTLMHLCRARVRHSLSAHSHGRGISTLVTSLPLPSAVHEYLLFKPEREATLACLESTSRRHDDSESGSDTESQSSDYS